MEILIFGRFFRFLSVFSGFISFFEFFWFVWVFSVFFGFSGFFGFSHHFRTTFLTYTTPPKNNAATGTFTTVFSSTRKNAADSLPTHEKLTYVAKV